LPAEPKHDAGSPLATIAGICLVGLLAAVGGLTAWRRRADGR
jgi:LPXTG-motif cell wall-anchored protein